jgi:hypothetical protein
MQPILELHMSGLGEGETPTLAIDPVRTNGGKLALLSRAEFSTVSEIIDGASKESSPNWREIRQAIPSAF